MPERPLRIAHVVRRFTFDEWGGTETVVWNTALNQLKLGMTPEILATSALSRPGEEIREEIRIRRFPCFYPYFPMPRETARLLDKKGGNPFVPALFRTLRRERFDLIHIHCGGRMAVMSALLAHRLRVPCVISLHGGHAAVPPEELRQMMAPTRHKFHYGGIFDRLLGYRRDAVAEADAVICISREEERRLAASYPGRRIVYLPNGVNVEDFRRKPDCSPREEWHIPSDRRLVLCVSRIDYQKNQQILLELPRHDPGCHLLLIGPVTAPWYHRQLLERAKEQGIADRVTVIPGLEPGDPRLKAVLHEADVFVLPSLHEPFGIVALESWAAGLPVVAARTGGLKDFIVPERNGLLFDPEDPAALVACCDRLFRDPELGRRLAENALSDVRAFSWEALTGRLLALYGELIRERA
ncbi:MAG: glycosyltransferase family 4 protein [Lentisphaeria bacterium]|nr:glycosyltransferase family 4 protein [Lentisphaeria bacterium]